MERKPIKRSEYIVKLSRDHHASLLFCWKIRQGRRNGIDSNRIKPYVAYFAAEHLTPHFVEEEDILFRSVLEDSLVQQAFEEHKQINMLVEKIAENDHPERFLDEIADIVDQHVRFEERVLFPHLEQIIPEVQLKEISEKLDQDPPKDTYHDPFWVKANPGQSIQQSGRSCS